MSELTIEKDVPKTGNKFLTAAKAMEVGDSVFFTDQKEADALCRTLVKTYGAGAFTMKTVFDDAEQFTGYRVWRDERVVKARKAKVTKETV